MKKNVLILGHNGMVGSSVLRSLKQDKKLALATISKSKLNLLDQKSVSAFFEKNKFDEVYLCAAKVGGISSNNSFPASFIYENLQIQSNVIHNCHKFGVKKLLFLGSSCIYPRDSLQPIKEEYLLSGLLEKNESSLCNSKNFWN
jgi:GDP-L-fucose synthase